jgi:hypothetical protein
MKRGKILCCVKWIRTLNEWKWKNPNRSEKKKRRTWIEELLKLGEWKGITSHGDWLSWQKCVWKVSTGNEPFLSNEEEQVYRRGESFAFFLILITRNEMKWNIFCCEWKMGFILCHCWNFYLSFLFLSFWQISFTHSLSFLFLLFFSYINTRLDNRSFMLIYSYIGYISTIISFWMQNSVGTYDKYYWNTPSLNSNYYFYN